MTQEELARRYWYNRMMNVTARGYRPQAIVQAAGSGRANPWKWKGIRDCPDKLLAILNSDNAPFLTFREDASARPPYKGFWMLDEIKYDDWRFDIWLAYGYGDEKSVELTELGFYKDNPNPDIRAIVLAIRK